MHTSSLAHMRRLVDTYLKGHNDLNIVDIGSWDVNELHYLYADEKAGRLKMGD
jgi:hypothetical protein